MARANLGMSPYHESEDAVLLLTRSEASELVRMIEGSLRRLRNVTVNRLGGPDQFELDRAMRLERLKEKIRG